MLFTALFLLLPLSNSKIYFQQTFDSPTKQPWTPTPGSLYGKFIRTAGWWSVNPNDKGLQTENSTSTYAISTSFPPFSTNSKPLIIQYTLRTQQKISGCINGYIKLLPHGFDPSIFNVMSPYLVMFGPDMCYNVNKCQIEISYKSSIWSVEKDLRIATDRLTHLYTLILQPDFSVVYLLDNEEVFRGSLKKDFGAGQVKDEVFEIEDIGGIGIELVQTQHGSLFDNILLTDSVEEAFKFSEETFAYLKRDEPEVLKEYIKREKKRGMEKPFKKASSAEFF